MRSRTLAEQIRAKTVRMGECLIWTGAYRGDRKRENRYAVICTTAKRLPNGRGRTLAVTRLIMEQMLGRDLDRWEFVCHHCDNGLCVEPSHLFLGDARSNMTDRAQKGRTAQGERHGKAKLTAFKVQRIRELACYGMPLADIARIWHLRSDHVYDVVRGNTWSHI